MTGPDLCPKCKGLHFKTASCITRTSEYPTSSGEAGKPKAKSVTSDRMVTTNASGRMASVTAGETATKRPVGRPKTITDMKAYKADKQRQYRADKKAGLR